jgi:hypothetical protein
MKCTHEIVAEALRWWAIPVLLLLAAWTAQPASAAQPDSRLDGQWAGTLVVGGRPMAVNLTINAAQSDAAGSRLTYGVPRSCTLDLEYVGPSSARQYFSFIQSNGGFCDRLMDGTLWIDVVDERTLGLNIATRDGQISESSPLLKLGGQSGSAIDPRLVGQWSGLVVVRGRPVRVELTVPEAQIGSAGTDLYYGAPRSCRLDAEYVGPLQGRSVFAFRSADGGYCDRLVSGLMHATPGADGTLAIDVSSPRGEISEPAALSR